MPTDNISSADLETAVARFRAVGSVATSVEALLLPNWDDDDWKRLFRFTSTRRVPAGEALIRRGEPGRTLYFVLHGQLEVIAHSGDGLSLGRMALVSAGSVLGEQAFFDAKPRSAGAWAVDDCEVAAMSLEQYAAFEESSPARARDLLFALGRVLAMRLRRTTAKVVGVKLLGWHLKQKGNRMFALGQKQTLQLRWIWSAPTTDSAIDHQAETGNASPLDYDSRGHGIIQRSGTGGRSQRRQADRKQKSTKPARGNGG